MLLSLAAQSSGSVQAPPRVLPVKLDQDAVGLILYYKNPSLIQHVRVVWEEADLLAERKGDHQQGEKSGGVKHHWTSVVCDTLNHGLALPQLFLLCSLSPD